MEVLKLPEIELSLSDGFGFDVGDVVVVGWSVLGFSSVADANQHELIRPHFPHGGDGYFGFGHAVGFADFVGDLIFFILSIFLGSEIVGSELESIVMSSFEPAQHRVIVGLSDHVFVGPDFL